MLKSDAINLYFVMNCIRACMWSMYASDGVIAEGECTHPALSFQRDCRVQKISCSFRIWMYKWRCSWSQSILAFYLSLRVTRSETVKPVAAVCVWRASVVTVCECECVDMRYVNWHTGGARLSTPFSLPFRSITQIHCVTAAVTNGTSISLYGIAEEVLRLSTLLTPW
jgi:hypothetical protein